MNGQCTIDISYLPTELNSLTGSVYGTGNSFSIFCSEGPWSKIQQIDPGFLPADIMQHKLFFDAYYKFRANKGIIICITVVPKSR